LLQAGKIFFRKATSRSDFLYAAGDDLDELKARKIQTMSDVKQVRYMGKLLVIK